MNKSALIWAIALVTIVTSGWSAQAGTYPPEVQAKLDLCFKPENASALPAAIDACTALLAKTTWDNPHRARIFGSRANAYDVLGKSPQAIADYDQAIALAPDEADAFYNRAVYYKNRHELTLAKADFEQAARLDPTSSLPEYYLGRLALESGDYAAAVEHFTRVIAIDPKTARAYMFRSAAFGKLGQGDKAVADIETAVTLDPSLAHSIQVDGKPIK